MNKKVGFWKWLWIAIKEIPSDFAFAIREPFFQVLMGTIGGCISGAFTVVYPLTFPIPIILWLYALHGVYRTKEISEAVRNG